MGKRIVRVSGELFQMLLTEGTSYPNADGRGIRITKGLPEGAKLIGMSNDLLFVSDEWALKYEHPSWPDQPPGLAIPYLNIEVESFDVVR